MQTLYHAALCSFGLSGKVFHAPFLHLHPGFNLYAVVERTKNLARQEYPDVQVYRSIDDLLNDEQVDLVVVNTPNFTHFDYARKALLAGKHVVVEKPFTVTVQEAEELVQLAHSTGKMLSVFHNRRYDSDFRTVEKIIHDKVLGHIVEAEFHFDRYNPVLSPKEHKESGGPGTGVLYDLGPHLIDQAICLFGMPRSVFADIQRQREGSKVDDYIDLLFYYDTLRVRLKSGYFVKEPIPSFVLHGTAGSLLKSRADVQETELLAGKRPVDAPDAWGMEPESEQGLLHTVRNNTVIRERIPSLQGNYLDYYQGIYQALVSGEQPPVDAMAGLKVMRLIQAAEESQRLKKVIDL